MSAFAAATETSAAAEVCSGGSKMRSGTSGQKPREFAVGRRRICDRLRRCKQVWVLRQQRRRVAASAAVMIADGSCDGGWSGGGDICSGGRGEGV
eukprot:6183452-Pleurochrysis_carterae.AAC.1